MSHSNSCPEPFSYTAFVVYCAGGFAVEVLYDFNQVDIDVVKFHCGPEGRMPYSIECFLEIHKNLEEVMLVLNLLLTQYSQAENLFSCTASWSKPCLFLSYDRFCLRRQPV